MASEAEPKIILYDLACTKNVCFSPVVWRIRLMLNYKQIPYRTVFLEFPDIEPTLKELGINPAPPTTKYTVPSIHHLPTSTRLMDSIPIAAFLETHYPSPPLPLSSPLGDQLSSLARSTLSSTYRTSLMPREVLILSPPAADYFRRGTESALGHPLEQLLQDPDVEDAAWAKLDPDLEKISDMLRTNRAEGPFILGKEPSIADFFIAGAMQCARAIDEGVWARQVKYDGFRAVYEGCEVWMGRKD